MSIAYLLYLLSFICFLLATFGVSVGDINLIAAGLTLYLAAILASGYPSRERT